MGRHSGPRSLWLPSLTAAAALADLALFSLRLEATVPQVIVFVAFTLLCCLMPLKPACAAPVCVTAGMIAMAVPAAGFPALSCCMLLAVGVAFAFTPMPAAAGLAGIAVIETLWLQGTPALTGAVLFQLLAALAGFSVRQRRRAASERERAIEARLRSETVAGHLELASRLHDTVTNDLSCIITMTETMLLDRSDPQMETMLTGVRDRAQHALDQSHDMIDVLRGAASRHPDTDAADAAEEPGDAIRPRPDIPPTENPGPSWIDGLRTMVGEEERKLEVLGFRGECDVIMDGEPTPPAADVRRELANVIGELFANIRRHCAPPADYVMTVRIGADEIRVMEMNAIRPPERESVVSGRGLSLHRRLIAGLGGTMETGIEDDTWIVRITLPSNR
ncbi:histidine kinase [Bifidobacterium samirii]|uniref:Histidine kinase n=1 Tax=Bifidobacterium samirii TaxID=2306974 RepID=A0A430FX01_9BIFI|nr:histidine kinase [Bifidobacterium samirii]RSX58748.1 histidine kinase [Bifidobacterium samirii]